MLYTRFQQWLCVEQSCELFTDIRGRSGANNCALAVVNERLRSPVDKLCIFFLKFALILVQSKLFILRAVDKHEPSLTLRVALSKSSRRLI